MLTHSSRRGAQSLKRCIKEIAQEIAIFCYSFKRICTNLQLHSFSFTIWILWFSIEWDEKFLCNILVSSSTNLYPTLSICSWSSSSWILNNRASWSSSTWSPLALISMITLLIHPTLIPIFSTATNVLITFEITLSMTSRMLTFHASSHLNRFPQERASWREPSRRQIPRRPLP